MTQKTAIMKLIERLQEIYNDESFPKDAKDGILIAINTATNELNSLSTEKEQIIEAFEPRTDYGKRYESGEDFYNEKYGQ